MKPKRRRAENDEAITCPASLSFAGRTSELELLSAAWKEAHAGERRSVLIAGEPGVGKTRLAGEFAHHRAAAAIIERCGVARARAVNDYQWAVTLLTRDAPGDRQQVTAMLQTTLEYCRSQRYVTFESLIDQLR